MAGIYIHIPFCKRKCAYCDFYSIANTKYINEFVSTVCKEIELQKEYLDNETICTIYFGGGTPSVLTAYQINEIIEKINKHFKVENNNEITLEANPDDLNYKYVKELKRIGINRLSVGIQSFSDDHLQMMKRIHSVNQSVISVKEAQNAGISNISIDLIYGLPNLLIDQWYESINRAIDLKVKHISAYHLTIEPKTLFYKYVNQNKINLPTEEESLKQFKILKSQTAKNGFIQYEISNFALDGFLSLHNVNYWSDVKYLGLGPSAHSYNLTSRQWNIQNLQTYLDTISKGKLANEKEILSENEKFNDFLITSLRTMWGVDFQKLKNKFGKKHQNIFLNTAQKFLDSKLLKKLADSYILTDKGMVISDNIMSEFLCV